MGIFSKSTVSVRNVCGCCTKDITNGAKHQYKGVWMCTACVKKAIAADKAAVVPDPEPVTPVDPEPVTPVDPEPVTPVEPETAVCPWCGASGLVTQMAVEGIHHYCIGCVSYARQHQEVMDMDIPAQSKISMTITIQGRNLRSKILADVAEYLDGAGRRVMTNWKNVLIRYHPDFEYLRLHCDNRARQVEVWAQTYDGDEGLLGYAVGVEGDDTIVLTSCKLKIDLDLVEGLPGDPTQTPHELTPTVQTTDTVSVPPAPVYDHIGKS